MCTLMQMHADTVAGVVLAFWIFFVILLLLLNFVVGCAVPGAEPELKNVFFWIAKVRRALTSYLHYMLHIWTRSFTLRKLDPTVWRRMPVS